MNCAAVILAAGEGKRMKSTLPKVLHPLCGKPMIHYVIDELNSCGIQNIVTVVGHGREQITEAVKDRCCFAVQHEQLGTAHALKMAIPLIEEKFSSCSHLILCCGDTPLLTNELFSALISYTEKSSAHAVVVSAEMKNPYGYGRIIRTESGTVAGIVEHKDCSDEQLKITEINSGLYVFAVPELLTHISKISNKNAQNEYYLTDIIKVFNESGLHCVPYICSNPELTSGINDRLQLAAAEAVIQKRLLYQLMAAGVSIHMPDSVIIDHSVVVEADTTITGPCILKNTSVGKSCSIGPFVYAQNSAIPDNSSICCAKICNSIINYFIGEHS